MDHGGSLVAQCFMGHSVVIVVELFPQAHLQRVDGRIIKQIDLLVFHAPPQSFDEDVLHLASAAVHADFDAKIVQSPSPFGGSELAALIGVENLRNAAGGG